MKRIATAVIAVTGVLALAGSAQAGPGANAALECAQIEAPVPSMPGIIATYGPDLQSGRTTRGFSGFTSCSFGYKQFRPFVARCPQLLPPPDAPGPRGRCRINKTTTARVVPAPPGFSGSRITFRKTIKQRIEGKVRTGYRSIRGGLTTRATS